MTGIGIDIGSSCAKAAVTEDGAILFWEQMPTGWSSKDTAEALRQKLCAAGFDPVPQDLTPSSIPALPRATAA